MFFTRLTVLGNTDSGASELMQLMSPVESPTDGYLRHIDGYLRHIDSSSPFGIHNKSGQRYGVIGNDVSGQSESAIEVYTILADYILYCVDLSTPIDLNQLNEKLKNISKTTSASVFKAASQSIILVGTKSDQSNPELIAAFTTHTFSPECNIEPKRYITSTANNTGVEELKDGFFNLVQNKHWNKSVAELQSRLQTRGLSNLCAINQQLDELKTGLDNGNASFDNFVKNCHQHLSETLPAYKTPPLKQIITNFAYHLLWTTFAATLVGFTVGFMLGVWSGPGAFVTGILGASAAAQNTMIAAACVGAMKGGYELQRLFRPLNTAQADIRNFAFDIEHPDATVWKTYGLSA